MWFGARTPCNGSWVRVGSFVKVTRDARVKNPEKQIDDARDFKIVADLCHQKIPHEALRCQIVNQRDRVWLGRGHDPSTLHIDLEQHVLDFVRPFALADREAADCVLKPGKLARSHELLI